MDLPSYSSNPAGVRAVIVCIVGTALAAIFLGLRVANRVFILHAFDIDDCTSLAALVRPILLQTHRKGPAKTGLQAVLHRLHMHELPRDRLRIWAERWRPIPRCCRRLFQGTYLDS